jgi:type III pantothenate kinase
MSVVAIDIGNSRIGLGLFTEGTAADPALRYTHDQIDGDLTAGLLDLWAKANVADPKGTPGLVIASVVPELTGRIERLIKSSLGERAVVAGRDLAVPMKLDLADSSTVGTDRLLAALAAYVNLESSCVIVHAGTALVVDCVDPNGVFKGGAIFPGVKLCGRALHEFTAQLPLPSFTPPEDDAVFGRDTQGALNVGIYVGLRGAARELIERFAAVLGHWPHVVACGGDARTLLDATGLIDSMVPDLVLQGAALTWEHHHQSR